MNLIDSRFPILGLKEKYLVKLLPWMLLAKILLDQFIFSKTIQKLNTNPTILQYHWVSMLAPRSSAKFLSYITGWLTVGGWQGAVASGGFLTGTLIQGLIVLTVPSYDPKGWQGTLLYWAVIFFAVFINTIVSSTLPKFEGLILILHIIGFFVILIPLVILGPHENSADVFKTWLNEGGWPTQGLSFFVGLVGNVFAFVGKFTLKFYP